MWLRSITTAMWASCLCFVPTTAQSFLAAISQFSELSNFTNLMYNNPGLAGALLTSNASSLTKVTVLVPDNSAFDKLQKTLGYPVGTMTVEDLEPVLRYHLLVDEVRSSDFDVDEGTTRPTFLTGPQFNNRSAGKGLGSDGTDDDPHNGQVLFIEGKGEGGLSKRNIFTVRQLQQPGSSTVQGGLGRKVNMTAVDGYWDGGLFQIVDNFLVLPLNCTETIRRWRVNGFRSSLDRTGLGASLDVTKNVTCFTPNDEAFARAGRPNVTASIFDLQQLTLYHLVNQPLYTNLLEDGQELSTFNNQSIVISRRNGSIYVNDARLINTNVITNNGLMHVIDKIITPSGQVGPASAPASASTPTAGPTDEAGGSASTETSTTPAATTSSSASLSQNRPSSGAWLAVIAVIFFLRAYGICNLL